MCHNHTSAIVASRPSSFQRALEWNWNGTGMGRGCASRAVWGIRSHAGPNATAEVPFFPLLPIYEGCGLILQVLQGLEITVLSSQTILLSQGRAHPSAMPCAYRSVCSRIPSPHSWWPPGHQPEQGACGGSCPAVSVLCLTHAVASSPTPCWHIKQDLPQNATQKLPALHGTMRKTF